MKACNRDIDTLIIGQGLAGSILASQLIQQEQSILIVGHEDSPSASRVAAGLFNPVTGQRFVLQPNAEVIIPAARELYRQLEQEFGQALFFEKQMLRIIRNEKELAAISKRRTNPSYATYLGEVTESSLCNAPFGVIEQRQTGYLDTNALLDCLQKNFIERDAYLSACFDYRDLELMDSGIRWQGIAAKRIIFCEGFMGKENPWFNWLPFQAAKGDILTMKTAAALPDQIINGGRWLLPLQNGKYKTGATYDHDLSTLLPTEKTRQELIEGMQQLLNDSFEFEIEEHKTGVRPNTLDKHPFIGLHPEQQQIGIFNGFGSKGSMLIPYYAQTFASHLSLGTGIPAEADIVRIK